MSPRAGRTLRLAAGWVVTVPRSGRDRDWILAAEVLLKAASDAGHAGARYRSVARAQVRRHHGAPVRHYRTTASPFLRVLLGDPGNGARAAHAEAARMPDHLTGRLLQESVMTAHPDGPGAGARLRVRMIRAVTASLPARDVELTDPAARRIVFHGDLDQVRLGVPAVFGGPRLARAVLDLAAADADAGEVLAKRTVQWKKIAAVDGGLHRQLLAAHLTARTPGPA